MNASLENSLKTLSQKAPQQSSVGWSLWQGMGKVFCDRIQNKQCYLISSELGQSQCYLEGMILRYSMSLRVRATLAVRQAMLLRRGDTEHVPGVPKRDFTLHPIDLAKNKQERNISKLLEIIEFAHGRNNKILTRTI